MQINTASRLQKIRTGRFAILFESRIAIIGLAMVIFWILVAVFAPLIAPYEPNAIVALRNQPPSAEHWMGTDHFGRDVMSRLIYGSQPILILAPTAVLLAVAVGVTLGLSAGYFGGVIDEILMRILDAVMAFPTLLLYMIIIAAVGASRVNVILAIAIGGIPGITRVVRSLVLDVRGREFVQAARLRGDSPFYIMFREILPNCVGPIIVDSCLRIGYAAFSIGGLGFLGLGLPPPDPDWGSMVSEGRVWLMTAPWIVLFPSLAIASLVVGLNLFADGLNEASQNV
jgi:peptide/nickel transport system permease protein